jgi:hypothetical protein
MEWHKSLGDWIEKDDLIASIYEYADNSDTKKENTLNIKDSNKKSDYDHKYDHDKSTTQMIVSYMDISRDRDITRSGIWDKIVKEPCCQINKFI